MSSRTGTPLSFSTLSKKNRQTGLGPLSMRSNRIEDQGSFGLSILLESGRIRTRVIRMRLYPKDATPSLSQVRALRSFSFCERSSEETGILRCHFSRLPELCIRRKIFASSNQSFAPFLSTSKYLRNEIPVSHNPVIEGLSSKKLYHYHGPTFSNVPIVSCTSGILRIGMLLVTYL